MKQRIEKIKPIATIALIYVLIQSIGLIISYTGPGGTSGIVENVREGSMPAVVQKPEEAISSAQIFFYVLVSTAILLVLIKIRLQKIIPVMVYLGLLAGILITLTGLFGDIGVILTLLVFLIAIWKRKNLFVTNTTLIFAIPGIGSWLGASLAFTPSLILLLLLSVYDLIAVFGTKHMITIAEESRNKIPLMVGVPVGERILALGTGDLTIPLVFTVSVLRDTTLMDAVITGVGGLIALILLFTYVTNKKNVMLPALPPLAVGLITGYLAAMIL